MLTIRQSLFPRVLQQKPTAFQEYILLPEITTSRITPVKKKRHTWKDGYHFGVLCCAMTAGTVLFINLIVTIVVSAKYHILGGIGTFQNGDCDETKRLDLWLHLPINILSTLLLGASNYSMQCLCAPTRQDVDDAHRQNTWMDIGVPSVRNIFRISWPRKILWCFLFFSSVPQHLVYNSVIFSSTSVSNWIAFAVTNDFLAGAAYNINDTWTDTGGGNIPVKLGRLRNSTSLVRLENEACITAYHTGLVSVWSDLLVVSTQQSSNNSYLNLWAGGSGINKGRSDLCYLVPDDDDSCYHEGGMPNPYNWVLNSPGQPQVSYCMAAKAQQQCKMRFSVPLMIAVVVFNLVKVICIGVIVWKLDPYPLVTIGDAIASFLDSPDPTTIGNCLSAKSRFTKGSTWATLPSKCRRQRYRWFASASLRRWFITNIPCALALGAAIYALVIGTGVEAGNNRTSSFSLGFGAINAGATFGTDSLVGNILIANTPQLLLSFLYFAYNGLWTNMLLTHEWSGYAKARKLLRVTSPTGGQRSTYYLQLPYRYGVPLLIISGTLHWLVSQSLFLVKVEAYFENDAPNPEAGDNINACGYSPIAILTTIIMGTILLALGIATGFRRYQMNGIPFAGSCSAAISAACHPPLGDDRASRKAVMWGACGSDVDGGWDRTMELGDLPSVGNEAVRTEEERVKIGHCSFTSFTVEEPVEGEMYAGLLSDLTKE